MPSPGASQRDCQIALSFLNVVWNQVKQQAFDASQELAGLRKRTNVARDPRILSTERAQSRNKVRVRKKAYVEYQIRIGWNSVAESETHNRDEQRPPSRVLKAVNYELPQFMHVEFRGVDYSARKPPNRRHPPALFAYSFGNGSVTPQRMRSPRLAKTPH